MHICLTAQEHRAEMDLGGIGAYTWHLAAGLRQVGHRVTLLPGGGKTHTGAASPALPSAAPTAPPALAPPAPAPRWRRLGQRVGLRGISRLQYAWALAHQVKTIAGDDPLDIVETPDWGAEGFFLARRKQIPLVVKLHTPEFLVNWYDKRPTTLDTILIDWLEKQTILHADLIMSPSASLAQIVSQQYNIPRARIQVLPYPIDEKVFTPAGSTQGDEDATPVVLYVGRLMRRKGVFVFARAIPIVARACPSAVFLLVGSQVGSPYDRTQQQEIRKQIADPEIQGRVHFLPRQPREHLISLYHQAALCVVPSLYDNLPYACLEAMACGKPVVASAVGGLAEILRSGENGLLVPPDEPRVLAEQLLGLLGDRKQRRQLGQNARSYIEENLACVRIAQATASAYAALAR